MNLVQGLLNSFKQVKQSYETQNPPLLDAANDGNVQLAARLIAKGADVNAHSPAGWTALHWAMLSTETKMVPLLLEHGADINAVTMTGQTALHMAAENGSDRHVAYLLEAGANPNLRDSKGQTPLGLATDTSHDTARKLLLLPGRQKVVALLQAQGAVV